ncbi:MAG: hypothetical protein NTU44_13855, partial [Bacteroidetes bacterium]|nr:hypothetical protein [Bacteroidota bacterium]
MYKILFLTHGSETGSEYTLFNLINYLDKDVFEITLLTRYDEFCKAHTVNAHYAYHEAEILSGRTLIDKFRDKLTKPNDEYYPFRRYFDQILQRHQPDLIY